MDGNIVFLYGDIDKKFYMKKPKAKQKQKACNLAKSLYDLKLALKQLHQKFDNITITNELKTNECNTCIYIYIYIKDTYNDYIILCLYVDKHAHYWQLLGKVYKKGTPTSLLQIIQAFSVVANGYFLGCMVVCFTPQQTISPPLLFMLGKELGNMGLPLSQQMEIL